MIILIVSKAGKKFWTKEYKIDGNFFKFYIKTKAGLTNEVMLHKDNIIEMTTLEQDFPNQEEE
jgi:hypothetical protein